MEVTAECLTELRHSAGAGDRTSNSVDDMLLLPLLLILRWAPVAQLDRALACGAKGRRFESCRVYQQKRLSFA
jgi:hypothetical protein